MTTVALITIGSQSNSTVSLKNTTMHSNEIIYLLSSKITFVSFYKTENIYSYLIPSVGSVLIEPHLVKM